MVWGTHYHRNKLEKSQKEEWYMHGVVCIVTAIKIEWKPPHTNNLLNLIPTGIPWQQTTQSRATSCGKPWEYPQHPYCWAQMYSIDPTHKPIPILGSRIGFRILITMNIKYHYFQGKKNLDLTLSQEWVIRDKVQERKVTLPHDTHIAQCVDNNAEHFQIFHVLIIDIRTQRDSLSTVLETFTPLWPLRPLFNPLQVLSLKLGLWPLQRRHIPV